MNNRVEINGERLRKARIYRGLTVAEVAEKIGCKRQTIALYESGKTKSIDGDSVEQLAKNLAFPFKFFIEQDSNVNIGSTYFRALLTTNKKYRSEQIQKMEFIAGIYVFLRDYISGFPQEDMPVITDQSPEEAAELLRNYWGLGTRAIENIVHEAEQHGIIITTFGTSTDDIDAFSQMVDAKGNQFHLIGYSNNKTSAARIHFDIAHELGHICLHSWNEDIEDLPKEEFRERENEANRFAAAFLLPEESFRKDAERSPLSLPYYKQLKRKWKVSMAAMIRRSYSLGLITRDQYQNLIRVMQRRGMRKEEPLDDELITASPALLRTAVLLLLSENVFSPKEFVDELSYSYDLSLTPSEIEFLLDLPDETLTGPKTIHFPNLYIK